MLALAGLIRRSFCVRLALSVFSIAVVLMSARYVMAKYQGLKSDMTPRLMSDFGMRYNEASCVKDGVNPFDVWRGAVVDDRYEPWTFDKMYAKGADFSRCVHAYPPWEYTFMLPLAGLSRRMADYVFMGLMFGGLGLLSCCWFSAGWRITGRLCWGLLLLAFSWSQSVPIVACIIYGNFGIWIAVSVAAALYCHYRRWDGWAGVFWALAMVKPQIAMIFLVPLVLLRKWSTLGVWCSLVFVATMVPAVLCRCSPVDMVLCITEYSAGQFTYTGFVGRPIFASLVSEGGVSPSLLSGASAMAGGLICAVCTIMIARRRNMSDSCESLAVFVPALVLSTIWATSRIYDFCIHGVTTPLLVLFAIITRDHILRCVSVLLALLTASMFIDQFQSGQVNVCSLLSVLALVVFSYRFSTCGGQTVERVHSNA